MVCLHYLGTLPLSMSDHKCDQLKHRLIVCSFKWEGIWGQAVNWSESSILKFTPQVGQKGPRCIDSVAMLHGSPFTQAFPCAAKVLRFLNDRRISLFLGWGFRVNQLALSQQVNCLICCVITYQSSAACIQVSIGLFYTFSHNL